VFETHAGLLAFPVHHAFVCIVKESPGQILPFMLTTEYPDETIYGGAFRFAHTVQMAAVIEAAALLAERALRP
jgi:hypothetical protein